MLNTYYYRDMKDAAKGIDGRGSHSDNVIFALKIRDMLKSKTGISPRVEQTFYGDCDFVTATFNGLNDAMGIWFHFGVHTVENNFSSMDNGYIEAVVQAQFEYRVGKKLNWTTDEKDYEYYPCIPIIKSFRSVVARRVNGEITIDEKSLARLVTRISKSIDRSRWEARYVLAKHFIPRAIKSGYRSLIKKSTREVVHG